MNNIASEAELLIADMRYELYGPNGLFVILLDIELVAAASDGTIRKIIHLQTMGDDYKLAADMEASILSFINENFSEGATPVLIANSMHTLLLYFEQSASSLVSRLRGSTRIDIDTLISMVPQSTPLYTKTLRQPEHVPDAGHTLEVYLRFKEAYSV